MLGALPELCEALVPSKGVLAEALRSISFQQLPQTAGRLGLLRGQLLAALRLVSLAHSRQVGPVGTPASESAGCVPLHVCCGRLAASAHAWQLSCTGLPRLLAFQCIHQMSALVCRQWCPQGSFPQQPNRHMPGWLAVRLGSTTPAGCAGASARQLGHAGNLLHGPAQRPPGAGQRAGAPGRPALPGALCLRRCAPAGTPCSPGLLLPCAATSLHCAGSPGASRPTGRRGWLPVRLSANVCHCPPAALALPTELGSTAVWVSIAPLQLPKLLECRVMRVLSPLCRSAWRCCCRSAWP